MNKTFLLGMAGFMLLMASVLPSCKKAAPAAKVTLTPMQTLVNSDTTLTLFHQMLLQANDAGLLANDSAITWLLPTNAVLRAGGYTEIFIDSMSSFQADELIRYSYLSGKVTPQSGSYTGYSTLLGYTIYGMTDSSSTVYFNGNTAASNPTTVGNALVYRMNTIPSTPADSLLALLEGDSTLSILAEVFVRTNLVDSLLQNGTFTLLAPDNNAFINAGYDSVGAIDSANFSTILQLAEYHVVTGAYFTNTLLGASSLTSLQGETVAVSVSNGTTQFKGKTNTSNANLIYSNQVAGSNIIVQKIDEVLSP